MATAYQECPACGWYVVANTMMFAFCPECGAAMPRPKTEQECVQETEDYIRMRSRCAKIGVTNDDHGGVR